MKDCCFAVSSAAQIFPFESSTEINASLSCPTVLRYIYFILSYVSEKNLLA